jgi:hypothetical protein
LRHLPEAAKSTDSEGARDVQDGGIFRILR